MTVKHAVFAVALSCLLARADGASAAFALGLSTLEAAPGDTVTARTLGEGAFTASIPPGSPPIRVFLVSTDVVSPTSPEVGVDSPDDDRLVELGELTVDGAGNGWLIFVVPNVPAGEYTTVTHCVPCGPSSAGRELVATGPLEPFVILDRTSGGTPAVVLALVLVGAALGVAAIRLVRRFEVE